jgi:hypothetical protein
MCGDGDGIADGQARQAPRVASIDRHHHDFITISEQGQRPGLDLTDAGKRDRSIMFMIANMLRYIRQCEPLLFPLKDVLVGRSNARVQSS